MNHKSGTIQTDITGTNKPISLAQFDPIYPMTLVKQLQTQKTLKYFLIILAEKLEQKQAMISI